MGVGGIDQNGKNVGNWVQVFGASPSEVCSDSGSPSPSPSPSGQTTNPSTSQQGLLGSGGNTLLQRITSPTQGSTNPSSTGGTLQSSTTDRTNQNVGNTKQLSQTQISQIANAVANILVSALTRP